MDHHHPPPTLPQWSATRLPQLSPPTLTLPSLSPAMPLIPWLLLLRLSASRPLTTTLLTPLLLVRLWASPVMYPRMVNSSMLWRRERLKLIPLLSTLESSQPPTAKESSPPPTAMESCLPPTAKESSLPPTARES